MGGPSLLRTVRAALLEVAEPGRAPAMQAYMKSTMPYLGVPAPKLKTVCREVFASYPFADAGAWRGDVLRVWRAAKHREERYAAIRLSAHRKAKAFQTLETLPMYEEMIVTGDFGALRRSGSNPQATERMHAERHTTNMILVQRTHGSGALKLRRRAGLTFRAQGMRHSIL